MTTEEYFDAVLTFLCLYVFGLLPSHRNILAHGTRTLAFCYYSANSSSCKDVSLLLLCEYYWVFRGAQVYPQLCLFLLSYVYVYSLTPRMYPVTIPAFVLYSSKSF
ncbi:hypothetical protein F4680DRAFT_344831 [Xylaria scruposa]|nr:hypothetical protein F4680DRAFT_344831 [Xylaria scruposa]